MGTLKKVVKILQIAEINLSLVKL